MEAVRQLCDPASIDGWGFTTPRGEDVNEHLRRAVEDGMFEDPVGSFETMQAGELPPWNETGVPISESPASFGHQGGTVRMPVGDFYQLQTYIGVDISPFDTTEESFWEAGVGEARVESIVSVLLGKEAPDDIFGGIPMPYVTIGRDGYLINTQEGRHRTLAARRANLDTLPVRITMNPEKTGERRP